MDSNGPRSNKQPLIGFELQALQAEEGIQPESAQDTAGCTDTADQENVQLSIDEPEMANNTEQEQKETLHFHDGVRKIDYVLSWRDSEDVTKGEKRSVFEENMEKEGLQLEREAKENSRDGKTHFMKIHAPWDVLTRMAELMGIKMPIKEYDILDDEISQRCGNLPRPFDLPEGIFPEDPDYFTASFDREREKMFIIKDKNTFFTTAQRSLMVHELLLRIKYDNASKEKFGIDRLLKQGVYMSAFPLHEGPFHSHHSILTVGAQNERHLLYETWARFGRWYYNQPLDLVRNYFGEKIGIYFTWLGYYTMMLIPASIVGLVVFLYGAGTIFQNIPSEEICDPYGAGNYTMCPLCDRRCTYWKLYSSCNYSRLTYLFDNYATVFFAGFMAIWATLFLEMWKRKQASLQYDWDVADFALEEYVRPDFEAKTKKKKVPTATLR